MTIDKEHEEDGREQRDEHPEDRETEDSDGEEEAARRKYVGDRINRIPRCCRNLSHAGLPVMGQPRALGTVLR